MRILVIQTAYLGDLVLTTPLLRELSRANPAARISVLTTPLGREVFSGLPSLYELLVHGKRGGLSSWLAIRRLARSLRKRRFDTAIAAHRSHRSALLLRLSGAPRRIGFAGAPGAWAYTERVPRELRQHAVRRYLRLGVAVGGRVEGADERPEIRFRQEHRSRVDFELRKLGVAEGQALLALAPGSIWATKRWSPQGFAAVAAAAAARGLHPVLVGSQDERRLAENVAALCPGPSTVLAGATSVKELAALLARSRVLVANDNGAGHVASAVGTPVVSIFGPTVPSLGYTPVGSWNRVVEHTALPCRPCDRHGQAVCPLGHFRCMREIEPGQVVRMIDRALDAAAEGWRPALRSEPSG